MLSAFMVNGMPDPLLFRSNVGDVIELGALRGEERRHDNRA